MTRSATVLTLKRFGATTVLIASIAMPATAALRTGARSTAAPRRPSIPRPPRRPWSPRSRCRATASTGPTPASVRQVGSPSWRSRPERRWPSPIAATIPDSARRSARHRLQGVRLADGRTVARRALFIRPALRAHADGIAATLGCELLEDGLVRGDAGGRTSVPGVWAAGNATNPRAQVITAAGEGSAVAIAINAELVADDVGTAVQHVATATAA